MAALNEESEGRSATSDQMEYSSSIIIRSPGKLWEIGRLSADNAIISRKGVSYALEGEGEEIRGDEEKREGEGGRDGKMERKGSRELLEISGRSKIYTLGISIL